MQEKTKNMTSGSPMRLIFLFTLPLMVGSVFQQGYMIADSIIVGRGVGVNALASLGAADWINWLFLWAIQGFANGLSVMVAQTFGAKDEKGLRKTTAMITVLCIIIGLLLMIIGLIVAEPLLHLLKTDSQLMIGAKQYLTVLFIGTPAVLAYNIAAAILRCMGNSHTPLIAMVMAAVLNIALDLLFVLVFRWGIIGAAAATILAQLCAFLFCLKVLCASPLLQLKKEDFKINTAILKRLLSLGTPLSVQHGIIAAGGMVLQSVINSYGITFVAGFTATNKLYGILESTAIALDQTMVAYIGQNRGACEIKRIDQGVKSAFILSVIISSIITILMIVFGKNILGLFISGKEASAVEVVSIAYRYLFTMSCPLLLLFLLHVYRASLQGLGNVFAAFVSGIIEMVMRISAALLLPKLMGSSGIFFAECAAWGAAGIYVMIYYYTHITKIKEIISDNR